MSVFHLMMVRIAADSAGARRACVPDGGRHVAG